MLSRRVGVAAILVLAVAAGALAGPLPNHVLLRLEDGDREQVRTALSVLRQRLERFGVEAVVSPHAVDSPDQETGLRVRLPALAPDQVARVERLLTSPGRVDVTDLSGRVVVPAEGVVGLTTTLVEGRIRFRIRLREAERKLWAQTPEHLVFRWDGRPVHYFRREEKPFVTFPAALPRDDLRCLFCCVLHGPLPAVEIVERSLDAVSDPALAWDRLVEKWTEPRIDLQGEQEFRRRGDEPAVYVARTRIVEKDGRRVYLLKDSLVVPGHPERNVRQEVLCDAAWRLIEGRILVGRQTIVLEPEKTFIAPGAVIRVATLLPHAEGRAYGPGGRLRVRTGPIPGTREVRAPGRPASVVVKGVRVVSLILDEGGEPLLRTR